MPSRLTSPIIAVNLNQVVGVDPSDVNNLFSMWTIFSKCAESLENGRRLENLSWRLWNRETFCCDDGHVPTPPPATNNVALRPIIRKPISSPPKPAAAPAKSSDFTDLPELSSSVDSAPSDDELSKLRPNPNLYRGREKHMTRYNLAKMLKDINHNQSASPEWMSIQRKHGFPKDEDNHSILSQSPDEECESRSTHSSDSTDTTRSTRSIETAHTSHSAGSTHSVVRGFSPSRVSSSCRSAGNLSSAVSTTPNMPLPAKKPSPALKKSKRVFYIGSSSSSDDDMEDSYNSRYRSGSAEKRTKFVEEVSTRTVYDDDMSSDDELICDSILEEDDDDLDDHEEWESSTESGMTTEDEGSSMFKRVESRPQLASRRSLLSTMLHEPQRAAAIVAAATRSTPSRRSIKEPFHSSIKEEAEFPGSKPINTNASHGLSTLFSPRTTRRNMLATELTESLRKHLLWERQQKNTTASAHLKRRHTAADVTKLVEYPQSRGKGCASKNNSWNNAFFNQGQYEYHAAGW